MLFWRKRFPDDAEKFSQIFFGPTASAIAYRDCIQEYSSRLQSGISSYPAYSRNKAGVAEVWRDSRLEAMQSLLSIWGEKIGDFCDFRNQRQLILQVCDELSSEAGQNSPKSKATSGIIQAYAYLAKAAYHAGSSDHELNPCLLSKIIMQDFRANLVKTNEFWQSNSGYDLIKNQNNDVNKDIFLFSVIHCDVTKKTKRMALCSRFGPYPEGNIKLLSEKMETYAAKEIIKKILIKYEESDSPEIFGKSVSSVISSKTRLVDRLARRQCKDWEASFLLDNFDENLNRANS